jgi:hypothetical protein
LNFDVKIIFFAYLALLKVHNCFEKEFGDEVLATLLNVHKHGMGASFFKVIMQAN